MPKKAREGKSSSVLEKLAEVIKARIAAGIVFARGEQIRKQARAAVASLAPEPAYRVAQRQRRQRLRMVIMHDPNVGQSITTSDGRGYYRHTDNSIRREDSLAVPGRAAALKAAFQR